jgi:glutamate racemase
MPGQIIGIFDSGVGGLSVLRHIRAQLPFEPLIYVADQAHVPYGSRSADEIRQLCEAISRFLQARQAKLIVVACNTASGAALTHLRRTFPNVPIIGMEPAVKPAADLTRIGKVGVLATVGTFRSQRYASLMAQYAGDVEVLEDPCVGLVELIEMGRLDTFETRQLLQKCLAPMLAAGVDTIVLGCTHYPFVLSLIEQIAGENVTIIDPAPAVARQTGQVLRRHGLLAQTHGSADLVALTTGDGPRFFRVAKMLLEQELLVSRAYWGDGGLLTA